MRFHRRWQRRRAVPRLVWVGGVIGHSRCPPASFVERLIPDPATLAVTAAIFSMAISVAVTFTVTAAILITAMSAAVTVTVMGDIFRIPISVANAVTGGPSHADVGLTFAAL